MAGAQSPGNPRSEERDRLTQLVAAPGALARIEAWHQEATARGERASVHAMLLRLKDFSTVNLAHGEAQGDSALLAVAGRMLHFARELGTPWVVARISGDSFLLAANQETSRERWQWLAEELGRWIARPVVHAPEEPRRLPVRLRPRIALTRSIPDEPPRRMLARLAEASELNRCKPLGCPVWVDGAFSPAARGRAQLDADLAAALERGEIEILFQPQFGCEEGRIVGAEALARWRHPLLGSIGAEALFAIAERADQLEQVSRHIIRAALMDAGAWPRHLQLSLNITAADLFQIGFDRVIADLAEETGFALHRLTLEITEKALVCDLERASRSLQRLAEAGTRIALDDFGAGFCNFRYLKLLPLQFLKLDRSMVQNIAEDPRDLAVLRAILAMAKALNLDVIAEGVETEGQRDAVLREGCASWQGFLGSEPLAGGEFLGLVAGTPR